MLPSRTIQLEEELHRQAFTRSGALREATEAVKAGDLAAPALPAPQRHLSAVPTRRSA